MAGRPKKSDDLRKVRTNLCITKEAKEMYDSIRNEHDISISEFLENAIRKEYKKITKKSKKECQD